MIDSIELDPITGGTLVRGDPDEKWWVDDRAVRENVVVGIDQSVRGTAAVVLTDMELSGAVFWADTNKDAVRLQRAGGICKRILDPWRVLPPFKVVNPWDKTARLAEIWEEIQDLILRVNPRAVAFEDYAPSQASSARALGEVGGIIRVMLWNLGVPFRTHDPAGVKLFATGSASAEKADIIMAIRCDWSDDINWSEAGKSTGAAGNLADAMVLARFLGVELAVRAGELDQATLPPSERAALSRTTKTLPENVLLRPFTVRRGQ